MSWRHAAAANRVRTEGAAQEFGESPIFFLSVVSRAWMGDNVVCLASGRREFSYAASDGGDVRMKDPRIDAYINKAADFAKPIVKKLRALVHKACPAPGATETIKWSHAAFEYPKGNLLCGI